MIAFRIITEQWPWPCCGLCSACNCSHQSFIRHHLFDQAEPLGHRDRVGAVPRPGVIEEIVHVRVHREDAIGEEAEEEPGVVVQVAEVEPQPVRQRIELCVHATHAPRDHVQPAQALHEPAQTDRASPTRIQNLEPTANKGPRTTQQLQLDVTPALWPDVCGDVREGEEVSDVQKVRVFVAVDHHMGRQSARVLFRSRLRFQQRSPVLVVVFCVFQRDERRAGDDGHLFFSARHLVAPHPRYLQPPGFGA
mmetsp:Transcript_14951/g.37263  ORF Transcript_14951/g.37263 Transcript_14951/m.37263 type:complete len:250 (-) Transcript_14951:2696-3445(-)